MRRGHHLVATAAASLCVAATFATPAALASAGQDHLTRGQRLTAGQQLVRITNAAAHTWLVMQSDGNLVLYTTGVPVGSRHTC